MRSLAAQTWCLGPRASEIYERCVLTCHWTLIENILAYMVMAARGDIREVKICSCGVVTDGHVKAKGVVDESSGDRQPSLSLSNECDYLSQTKNAFRFARAPTK